VREKVNTVGVPLFEQSTPESSAPAWVVAAEKVPRLVVSTVRVKV